MLVGVDPETRVHKDIVVESVIVLVAIDPWCRTVYGAGRRIFRETSLVFDASTSRYACRRATVVFEMGTRDSISKRP